MKTSPKVSIIVLWGSGLFLWFAFDLFMEGVVFDYLQWNGTTKNDWFFILWWMLSGLWTLYCLKRFFFAKNP